MTIDIALLRQAFGSFMTGVTVVTTQTKTKEWVGFTANSFSSVSLDPPLLLNCPAKSLSSFSAFDQCKYFAVNVLAENQQDVSTVFAGSSDDRFAQVDWHIDEFGSPLINGAITQFSCQRVQSIEAGDHHILVGEIKDFVNSGGLGLGYSSGGYFSLGTERRAAEVAACKTVNVGVLVESHGRLLIAKNDQQLQLPTIAVDSEQDAAQVISDYLLEQGCQVELGTAFSVFSNDDEGQHTIFYRATSVDGASGRVGQFVPLLEIDVARFAGYGIRSMLARYLRESKNGIYGMYFGTVKSGGVH